MDYRTYRAKVRHRRDGRWRVTVPELPGRPGITVSALGNAPALLIEQVALHLGVSRDLIGIDIGHPIRVRRRPTALTAQLVGAAVALSGVYGLLGWAATLCTAGVVLTALGVLREGGRI